MMKKLNDKYMRVKPEILAPAGDFISLQAAIDAGADSVYLGIGELNMRSASTVNFKIEDLPEIARRCRGKVKVYVTLNTILFEGELKKAESLISIAKEYVDAFIVSDWGAIELCKKYHVPFHISTQMSVSNSLSAEFLRTQGASRIVLARECTLSEVKDIAEKVDVEIECFVHGAQCLAHSGRCLMSHVAFGKSANRGECLQPCRRKFAIKSVDYKNGSSHDNNAASMCEFELEGHTILSAKDLCSIHHVDKLIDAGVSCFKIEGRARNANYVKVCVSAYRRAVEAVINGQFSQELADKLLHELETVFHREFSSGLFFGRPGIGLTAVKEDSLATTVKRHIGVVVDYFTKAGVAQIKVQDHDISVGDEIQIHGLTTGVLDITVDEMRRDELIVQRASRGDWITLKTPKCRRGDKVFFILAVSR
jgi:putative protease